MYDFSTVVVPRARDGLVDLLLGFDRDLSIAGRVMVKTEKEDFVQKLVKIARPSIAT